MLTLQVPSTDPDSFECAPFDAISMNAQNGEAMRKKYPNAGLLNEMRLGLVVLPFLAIPVHRDPNLAEHVGYVTLGLFLLWVGLLTIVLRITDGTNTPILSIALPERTRAEHQIVNCPCFERVGSVMVTQTYLGAIERRWNAYCERTKGVEAASVSPRDDFFRRRLLENGQKLRRLDHVVAADARQHATGHDRSFLQSDANDLDEIWTWCRAVNKLAPWLPKVRR